MLLGAAEACRLPAHDYAGASEACSNGGMCTHLQVSVQPMQDLAEKVASVDELVQKCHAVLEREVPVPSVADDKSAWAGFMAPSTAAGSQWVKYFRDARRMQILGRLNMRGQLRSIIQNHLGPANEKVVDVIYEVSIAYSWRGLLQRRQEEAGAELAEKKRELEALVHSLEANGASVHEAEERRTAITKAISELEKAVKQAGTDLKNHRGAISRAERAVPGLVRDYTLWPQTPGVHTCSGQMELSGYSLLFSARDLHSVLKVLILSRAHSTFAQ